MLKLILTAVLEAVYVSMVLILPLAIWCRNAEIKEAQSRKRSERKRQLAERESEYQCQMIRKLFDMEKPKENRQSFTVKGVLAAEYYNQA